MFLYFMVFGSFCANKKTQMRAIMSINRQKTFDWKTLKYLTGRMKKIVCQNLIRISFIAIFVLGPINKTGINLKI